MFSASMSRFCGDGRPRAVDLGDGEELVVASSFEAAEGVLAVRVREEDFKAAKKAVRDVMLWRCVGKSLGCDSREALVKAFEEACRDTAARRGISDDVWMRSVVDSAGR